MLFCYYFVGTTGICFSVFFSIRPGFFFGLECICNVLLVWSVLRTPAARLPRAALPCPAPCRPSMAGSMADGVLITHGTAGRPTAGRRRRPCRHCRHGHASRTQTYYYTAALQGRNTVARTTSVEVPPRSLLFLSFETNQSFLNASPATVFV